MEFLILQCDRQRLGLRLPWKQGITIIIVAKPSPHLAFVDRFAGVFDFSGVSFRLRPNLYAPALCGLDSGAGPLADKAPLQFDEGADHLPHGAACRRFGVDVLRKRTEFHALLFQVIEHGYQFAQAATQVVQLPHDERVAGFESLQAAEQGRALGRGSRDAVVLEYRLHPAFFKTAGCRAGVWSSVETRA